MQYSDDSPDHLSLVPEGRGELLALLFSRTSCREQLEQEKQLEHYAACAQWAKALDSGLPLITNAFQPLPPGHPLAAVPVTDQAALITDVDMPAELGFVLDQIAGYWGRSEESRRYGFSVNHLTLAQYSYFFAAAISPEPGGQWVLAYEGRFSS